MLHRYYVGKNLLFAGRICGSFLLFFMLNFCLKVNIKIKYRTKGKPLIECEWGKKDRAHAYQ